MEKTLDEALAKVFGFVADIRDTDTTEAKVAAQDVRDSADWRALSLQARQALEWAEASQREGDWAAYGEALVALRRDLEALGGQATDMDFDGKKPTPEEAPEGPPEP